MRTIRTKLFVSMGALLILLVTFNYFLPKFFIARDTNKTAKIILEQYKTMQQQLEKSIEGWISRYFLENATKLTTFSKILEEVVSIPKEEKSLSALGAQIITYNPLLAYVQLEDETGQSVSIAPEDTHLYTPLWSPLDEGKLALYFPTHTPSYYVASLLPTSDHQTSEYYSLKKVTDAEEIKKIKASNFRQFEHPTPPPTFTTPNKALYEVLNKREDLLVKKSELIQRLVSLENTSGVLSISGYALFAEELFVPPMNIQEPNDHDPFVLVRNHTQPKLDLAIPMELNRIKIYMAFSLSSIASDISEFLNKPLLLSNGQSLTLLYRPKEVPVVLSQSDFSSWTEEEYTPFTMQIGTLTITLLTPTTELNAIPSLMRTLGHNLENKISLNLLISGILGLLIALFILSKLSKRITKPIAQLAVAAKEIGEGKSEGVSLPDTKNRKDEVAIFSNSFKNMVAALIDREKVHAVLNKVVSTEIAEKILDGNVELGGEEREVTLLFSDIRNFTHLSNTLSPKEVIEMLNDYMTTMCHEIDATHGVVDKFVGDEIIALYGAPLELEGHADQAVQAAMRMIASLKRWNTKRKIPLEIGIGLHTGIVCSGNMGALNRLNYTVIGANVNLASRLCSVAKPMQILLSRQTKEALKEASNLPIRTAPPVSLKGFDAPVEVFEIVNI